MASSILGITKKLRNLSPPNRVLSARSLSTLYEKVKLKRINDMKRLVTKISPIDKPEIDIVPVVEQWARVSHKISHQKLRDLIHALRLHGRYNHALQVSEWMSSEGMRLSAGDCAMRIDLIGKVRGADSAETFFNGISGDAEAGTGMVYGALLNCFARERLIDKSLSHMKKMKDLGIANALTYNSIMSLYADTEHDIKIPDILLEMRMDGFTPDDYSYRACLKSYARGSDLVGMERVLGEMESQRPRVKINWRTYAMVVNIFLRAGDRERALIYLKKCKGLVGTEALGFNFLMSYHAKLGDKDEMMRMWRLQRESCKTEPVDGDYVVILGLLVNHGEFEEAEEWVRDWEKTCRSYDSRVLNILLIGYCQNGLTEKAESMLREMVRKANTPVPESWTVISAGYLEMKKMDKAFECIEIALATGPKKKWKPKRDVLMAILDWLVDSKEVKEVEAYVNLMKNVIPISEEMYRGLIKAYVKAGKDLGPVLERMRSDSIDVDKETEKVTNSIPLAEDLLDEQYR